MKKKLEPLMSSGNEEWETPRETFERYDFNFGGFVIDVAATKKNALCRHYLTREDNALDPDVGWSYRGRGPYWCNPPYGRGVYDWIWKACEQQGIGNFGLFLLPARTDTRWFHDHVYRRPGVEFELLKGRLFFTLNGKPILDKKGKPTAAPFPSVLVYFGPILGRG